MSSIQNKRAFLADSILDPQGTSDEVIEILWKLYGTKYPTKHDILKMSGFDIEKTYDTAYPEPYANKIRELYPDFNQGLYIYDYSENRWGEMRNVYNMFAKKVLTMFHK